MRIIREDDGGWSPNMMALAIDWHLRPTCYVKGCEANLSTIILHDEGHFTLCEEHYQEGNQPGGPVTLAIVFEERRIDEPEAPI